MKLLPWGLLLVAALAWPSRAIGPLDGSPFDTAAEVLAFGLLLPIVWWLHPAFFATAGARALVVVMLVWKLASWALLPQGGWCGDFLVKGPPATAGWVLHRTWDARTLFEKPLPRCSAIVARGYTRPTQFPAWAINLPAGHDWKLSTGQEDGEAVENPRPPDGEYVLNINGALDTAEDGTLSIATGRDVTLTGRVDEQDLSAVSGATAAVPLSRGSHHVNLRVALTGRDWRLEPLWSGADLFDSTVTAIRPLTAAEPIALRIGRWVWPFFVVVLLSWWVAAAVAALRPTAAMVGATAVAGAAMALAIRLGGESTLARLAALPLAIAAFVPVPPRLRNARGAWLVAGVPWMIMIGALALERAGRFTLYRFGDDTLTYQRFAQRIFMQGFWLEGGQPTFWNQPLYRWICGALHVLFGDSSAGEMLWDGFGLLAGGMLAFTLVERRAGFRSGLIAAVAVLLTVALGPNWYMIGRGLSEISAAMWLCLAALCLVDARGSGGRALLAGLFAVLAFYTRLNHLPLVVALIALTFIDGRFPKGSMRPMRTVAIYLACVAAGVLLFAARTWYYTGEFSVFAGTTRVINATGLGLGPASFLSLTAWRRALESVLMIVTVQDPPRFDWRSLLVVAGVATSLLALLRVGFARRLPLAIAVVCLAAVAGGLVARGVAYPGRFSIHLVPIAVAASILTVASPNPEVSPQ